MDVVADGSAGGLTRRDGPGGGRSARAAGAPAADRAAVCTRARPAAPDVSPHGPRAPGRLHRLSRRPSSSRRWATTSTGNSRLRSPRPTRIGSRSIRRTSCPAPNRFSPIGASRFNLMFARLADWSGPILVEWTPDQPALAESRRQAILDDLDGGRSAHAGRTGPDRTVALSGSAGGRGGRQLHEHRSS